MSADVLQEIPDTELINLRDMYEKHVGFAPHVFSFFNTCIKWKKMKPNEKYLTLYSYKGDWRSTGTFILLMQYGCYDLFVFTLEKNCNTLYRALTETTVIDWKKRIVVYAVIKEHLPTVNKALKHMNLPIDHYGVTCLWCVRKEKALNFTIECPDDVYIGNLNVSHASLINDLWPHKYNGSEEYLSTFIKMNGGCGLFLKENKRLVSWVLKNQLGQLGILQTVEDQKRKGYGKLVTKFLAREIAEEGHDPYGCYDLFVFTLEKNCNTLYRALTETTVIDWKKRILIYAVIKEHLPTVNKALKHMNLPIYQYFVTCLWCIRKENALHFTIECPDDVYIGNLNVSHASLINDLWPHKYNGSEEHLSTFIKMNGGCGLFLKENKRLVSWVLKNHLGQLGMLQTVDDQKRKGYGKLVTKFLAREIAEEGHDPVGTVVEGNVASETMFKDLGFENLNTCTYVELN